MDKEEQILIKRLKDLSLKSYQNNMYTFSGFISLPQQDILYSVRNELSSVPYELYGGYEESERKIVRFGSEGLFGYVEDFPIVCLSIKPFIEKFADSFSHRDFLGAIMNLGIERNTIGDIVLEGKSAYLFCNEKIASFIMDELDKVKHTNVKCELVKNLIPIVTKEPVEKELVVTSARIDAVISKMYNISRNQRLDLFKAKKVFINGCVQENNSYFIKKGDCVSVRGYGKFDFLGIKNVTRKERICLLIAKYE